MLNIATVHWQSADWIEPQLRYFDRYLAPYRVFASLNGIDHSFRKRFFFADELPGTHPEKLNALAAVVAEHASPEEPLLFIDGDAFPVTSLSHWISQQLSEYRFVAVRRDENHGDQQPHPCFAFTTVGFWNEIGGDWRPGGKWRNPDGDLVTDVGGNLLRLLEDQGVDWLPLLRTNTVDLHPVWFGVYAHRVYHHGAGFRERVSRLDKKTIPEAFYDGPTVKSKVEAFLRGGGAARLPQKMLTVHPRRVAEAVRGSARKRSASRLRARLLNETDVDSVARRVYESLMRDPDFWRQFDDYEL